MVEYYSENLLRHQKVNFFVRSISDFYIMTGLAKTLMFDMEGVFLGEVHTPSNESSSTTSLIHFFGV